VHGARERALFLTFADGVAAGAPRALCNELAPCSQKLVDAFGIPDHLVAAPIASSAPSCMHACTRGWPASALGMYSSPSTSAVEQHGASEATPLRL